MSKENFSYGDKVKIIPTGQIGTITTLLFNGAVIEQDTKKTRRFTTVKFENLKKL